MLRVKHDKKMVWRLTDYILVNQVEEHSCLPLPSPMSHLWPGSTHSVDPFGPFRVYLPLTCLPRVTIVHRVSDHHFWYLSKRCLRSSTCFLHFRSLCSPRFVSGSRPETVNRVLIGFLFSYSSLYLLSSWVNYNRVSFHITGRKRLLSDNPCIIK